MSGALETPFDPGQKPRKSCERKFVLHTLEGCSSKAGEVWYEMSKSLN